MSVQGMLPQCFICGSDTPNATDDTSWLPRLEHLLQLALKHHCVDGGALCKECTSKVEQICFLLAGMREAYVNTRKAISALELSLDEDEMIYHTTRAKGIETCSAETQTDEPVQQEMATPKQGRPGREKKTAFSETPVETPGKIRPNRQITRAKDNLKTQVNPPIRPELNSLKCLTCGDKMKTPAAFRRHQKLHRNTDAETPQNDTQSSKNDPQACVSVKQEITAATAAPREPPPKRKRGRPRKIVVEDVKKVFGEFFAPKSKEEVSDAYLEIVAGEILVNMGTGDSGKSHAKDSGKSEVDLTEDGDSDLFAGNLQDHIYSERSAPTGVAPKTNADIAAPTSQTNDTENQTDAATPVKYEVEIEAAVANESFDLVEGGEDEENTAKPIMKGRRGRKKGWRKCKSSNTTASQEEKLPSHIGGEEDGETKDDLKDVTPIQANSKTGYRYRCGICNKYFGYKQVLKRHQEIVHNNEAPYQCDICHQRFKWKQSIKAHQSIHLGLKPFACRHCPKTFRNAGALKQHQTCHTGKKDYKCEVCNAEFTRAMRLTIHMRSHTGELPHVCEVCGKGFADPQIFKRHMMNHRGERPFICGDCGKSFTMARYLTEHRKSHTGQRNYLCYICGAAFANSGRLKRHGEVHLFGKSHKCTSCDKSFRYKEALESHMNIHRGLRPFRCPHCEKTFTHRSSLRQHLPLHNENRTVYACEFCAKQFYTLAKLRRHIETLHQAKAAETTEMVVPIEEVAMQVLAHEETYGEMVVEVAETMAIEDGSTAVVHQEDINHVTAEAPTLQVIGEVAGDPESNLAAQSILEALRNAKHSTGHIQIAESGVVKSEQESEETEHIILEGEQVITDDNTSIVVQTDGDGVQNYLPMTTFCVVSPEGERTEYHVVAPDGQNIVYQVQE